MATVTKPIALDESFNTTEVTPRNIADVLAEGLSHITGRTASEVEYDNTDSGLTSDDVQGAIDELSERPTLPSVDIQTAVDEFSTYNGGLLSECIIELVPVQSGSGDPSPDNVRPISGHTQVKVGDDGKNLFGMNKTFVDKTAELRANAGQRLILTNVNNDNSVTLRYNSGGWSAAYFVYEGIDGTLDYTVSYKIKDNTGSYTPTAQKSNLSNSNRLVIEVYGGNGSTAVGASVSFVIYDIQVELGSTATDYVPYNGYQLTVNLGGTYYSGTLDVVSGVFTPDTAIATVSDFAFTAGKSDGYLAKVEYTPSNFKNSIEKLKCNMMPYVEQSASWSETEPCYTIANNTKLRVYFDGDTLADFQSDFADIQIIYELATPTPIQLSPTMVKALVGENHLSAPLDGQEITESKYKQMFTFDDVNTQIESTYSEGISHNSVYRGKYLGDHVTDEQWDAIGDGSFRDLYIGDYWTINGINWRIAHFNYWLGTGDVKCNTNHVVIVPYGWVSTFNMNATDDTTGGYLNSEWYTTNRHFAVENIEADFGASHILSHRNFFSDAVSDGHASHGMWVDSTVDLMNEIMVCGSLVGSYSGKYYEVGCDKFQLALFKYNPPSTRMDVSYWLRGVSTASSFVAMGNFGLLDGFTASQILKIRPVFAIKK